MDLKDEIASLKNQMNSVVDTLGSKMNELKKELSKEDKEKFDRFMVRAKEKAKTGDIIGLQKLKDNFK
jgi:hypothetical protein